MPEQKAKSILSSKYAGAWRKAVSAHSGDETTVGRFNDLPAGVEGIAQLVKCRFDEYKTGIPAGEPGWFAEGIVLEPKEHAGKRTLLSEPLYETPTRTRKTPDQHIEFVLNHLRSLGMDTRGLAFEDLVPAMEELLRSGPTFRFRTWKGVATERFPTPRVNHSWEGACQYQEEETASPVEDNSDRDADTNGEAEVGAPFDGDVDAGASTEDPSELAQLAGAGDALAEKRLTALGLAAGMTVEQIQKAGKWQDVADFVLASQQPKAVAPEVLQTSPRIYANPRSPQPRDVFRYKPLRYKQPIEVEVTSVSEKSEVVNVVEVGKPTLSHKGVPWSELQPASY